MKAWLRLCKARLLLLCSLLVVLAGLAPAAYLAGLMAWQVNIWFESGTWIALPAALAFADRTALQGGPLASLLPFIPHLPVIKYIDWTWTSHEVAAGILASLHLAALPGLIGWAMIAQGISGALRQQVLIRIHKQRRKDPATVERVNEAGRGEAAIDGRREPVLGAIDLGYLNAGRAASHAVPLRASA